LSGYGNHMSKQGRKIAIEYGEKLPSFSSQEEADQYYSDYREKHLILLSNVTKDQLVFRPDFSPESLKSLEKWYFQLYETDTFQTLGITRDKFEACMAIYFGETVVRSANAQWNVEAYFLAPNKYQLEIQKGSFTMSLLRFTDHFRKPNNVKQESLFRQYKKYFAPGKQFDLDKEVKALLRRNKNISAITLYQRKNQCSLQEAKKYIESL
jgi:hypothetical protein